MDHQIYQKHVHRLIIKVLIVVIGVLRATSIIGTINKLLQTALKFSYWFSTYMLI